MRVINTHRHTLLSSTHNTHSTSPSPQYLSFSVGWSSQAVWPVRPPPCLKLFPCLDSLLEAWYHWKYSPFPPHHSVVRAQSRGRIQYASSPWCNLGINSATEPHASSYRGKLKTHLPVIFLSASPPNACLSYVVPARASGRELPKLW